MIGNLCYEVVIYERRNYLCVPSGHYAAWGEDLVLACRPGEIIPSERLRDTETGIGPGGSYLWLRAQRLRCRHWAGSYIYSVILLAAHRTYETIYETFDISFSAMIFRDMAFEIYLAC
ncbi:hypothetical protein C1H46_031634 [Malus baccata]|uniref:Uncharacterized protein n=1 Tax=Malus baccata TaxID=106549 RepID=A0A540L8K3_MALBA|nr:hypothetical protein C1H46_031634 [Malus baccata]